MVSRRSVRIKSSSVLKKLKKKIGTKPKNSVGIQEVNSKRVASDSKINAKRDESRTRRSNTIETKTKENKGSDILTRKTRNTTHQEDSRVKACTVLAVKLKYPYVGRTTSVKLNSRSTRASDSSKALPGTTVKSPENDSEHSGSRKSSRMRKPTSKELKSVLVSNDKKLGLEKHNGAVSSQKPHSRGVKRQISNEIFVSDSNVKDVLECVRCGITPSQFFGRDSKHDTVCCFCSLVRPPQELKVLLQLLKLDCCLKFLNQKNQDAEETKSSTLKKRKLNENPSQAGHKSARSSGNSDVRSLRERNSIRAQKEQNNQNSPKERKKNTGQPTKTIKQQKGNVSVNLNNRSSSAKFPNLPAVSSTRISARLMQKTFSRIRPSTKANKQTLSSVKDIRKNLKRKISPQSTQTPAKRRKLAENEVKKKTAREHACSSCNSAFGMQWKLKLHELTHADKSYPNVILRHAEVGGTSDVTNQNVEGECAEPMECDPSSKNAEDKDEQISKAAEHQLHTALGLQQAKSALENENSKRNEDDEHSGVLKQGKQIKSILEDNEESVCKDNGSDKQNTKISDAPANGENTEVNQKSYELDSHDVANSKPPLDKDKVVITEVSDVPAKCDGSPTCNDSTDQSTKHNKDVIIKRSDLSSKSEDICSPSTLENEKDKQQNKINSREPTCNRTEAVENEKSKATESAEAVAPEQSEVQSIPSEAAGKKEHNEESEEIDTSVKADEEINKLSDPNENEHEEDRSNEICENSAGAKAKMQLVEKSEMNQNGSKEIISVESNSENTADERRSETEERERADNDNQDKTDVPESNEIKVNGVVTNNGDESKSVSESQSTCHPPIAVNHAADNINSRHPDDEKMTQLYDQMNMIFEGDPPGKNKATKTETEKQLENGENACLPNGEKK